MDGLLYLSSAALLWPDTQNMIYNNVLVGSPDSDAVVPVYSQKFPDEVVPRGAKLVPPHPARDANHFTELKPTKGVNNDLKYIFRYASIGG